MTTTFAAIIAEAHDPKLGEQEGMVYQVWDDGEITLQKSGELLWQRILHTTRQGDASKTIDPAWFPCQAGSGHGYAFVTKENAEKISDMILKN